MDIKNCQHCNKKLKKSESLYCSDCMKIGEKLVKRNRPKRIIGFIIFILLIVIIYFVNKIIL